MLNALNAISAKSSLLTVPPWHNRWLLAAAAAGVVQQLGLLYVPQLAELFGTAPLSAQELSVVVALSLPVLLIDEAFKARARAADEAKDAGTGRQ
jgi:Ca2+ transporting ATPase